LKTKASTAFGDELRFLERAAEEQFDEMSKAINVPSVRWTKGWTSIEVLALID
jgi:hypothetical protein